MSKLTDCVLIFDFHELATTMKSFHYLYILLTGREKKKSIKFQTTHFENANIIEAYLFLHQKKLFRLKLLINIKYFIHFATLHLSFNFDKIFYSMCLFK